MKHPILYRVLEWMGFRPFFSRLYRVELLGVERIPLEGGAILTPNHESMIDPWLLGLTTPRPIRFMAKAELWDIPGVRWVMEKFGTFPVARGTGDRQAFGRAEQLLREGEILGIFPQGTCLPFQNRRWYRGAAKLALATGAPIVPVCIVGSERALRPGKFKIGFPRVVVLVGDPIEVAQAKPTLAAAKELTAQIERAVEELRAPYWTAGARLVPARARRLHLRLVQPRRDCLRRNVTCSADSPTYTAISTTKPVSAETRRNLSTTIAVRTSASSRARLPSRRL